jgi:serine/threonine-protein kinase
MAPGKLAEGQAQGAPAAPDRLGKYAVQGIAGNGTMGVVYRSFDPIIRRSVALKTIRRELLEHDKAGAFGARFRNEAQAAGGLVHPGIVAIYEYGEEAGYAYIAMEFVEGSSLRQCIEQNIRFTVSEAVSMTSQPLDALQYAHERGVWHRDIKPANIMITGNGRIKITDFGIARVNSSMLTQVGAIMGTLGSIAPELYLGEPYDSRVDVFAAGVVLYEMLTGTGPFRDTPENIMHKACYEARVAPSVASNNPLLKCYDAVPLQALAARPDERFASAGQFRHALLQAHAGAGQTASDQTVPDDPLLPAGTAAARALDPGLDKARGASAAGAPLSTQGPQPAPVSTASLLAAGWDLADLTRIERHLAHFIGPVAKVTVRRGASQTQDLPSLMKWLAENLVAPEDRSKFLASTAAVRPTAVASPSLQVGAPTTDDATRWARTRLTPGDVERAAQLLAVHLGPIAQVLVRRAAQPGVDREKFLIDLGAYLVDEAERTRFVEAFGSIQWKQGACSSPIPPGWEGVTPLLRVSGRKNRHDQTFDRGPPASMEGYRP